MTRTSLLLGWVLVAGAAGIFVVRGPIRSLQGGLDFAAPYAASAAWRMGQDPYDSAVLETLLLDAGRERDPQGRPAFTPSLYPPSTFVALAPLSLLTWKPARLAWLVICLLLYAIHLRALLRITRLQPSEFPGVLLVGGVIALYPYASGFALGQLAVASVTLVVISIERIESANEKQGGMILGVAALLKPQIAVPFIVFHLLRGRIRPALIAGAICVAALGLGVGWLSLNGVDWLTSWTANRIAETRGGGIDPTGPTSAQMVDFRPLLAALFSGRTLEWVGVAVAGIGGGILYVVGRKLSRAYELLLLANVAVLLLFAGYHRFYDAAVLSLPLAWAIAAASRGAPFKRPAIAAILCCSPFFFPGAWALQKWSNEGTIPPRLAASFVWDAVVLRHQIWALIALECVLLFAVIRATKRVHHSAEGHDGGATAVSS